MAGINLRDDTQATDDPMVQPVFGVFYWLPWVLLPRESWSWFVPYHSTAWLYLFQYKRLWCSTSEISKGNILGYYPYLGSLRYGTSTAFLAVLWAALPSKKSKMRRRSLYSQTAPPILAGYGRLHSHRLEHRFREPLVCFLELHKPMDVQLHCVIKKGFSWRGKKEFFPYKHIRHSTRSISQGTEVKIVTE